MKCFYKLMVDDKDLTGHFNLCSMSIRDEAGEKSDSLELVLDDEDGLTEIPNRKVRIKPFLGLENGLIEAGDYLLANTEASGFPAMITLHATAVPLNTVFGTIKERSWSDTSIAKIVKQIANENQKPSAIDNDIGKIKIKHINQTQSDMHFLRSLAREYGAIFKLHTDHVIFVKRGTSVSGLLETVRIDSNIKTDWHYVGRPLTEYTGVRVKYYDENKEVKTVLAGTDDRVYDFKFTKKDIESARKMANQRLKSFLEGSETLSFTLTISKKLNPISLTAGQNIEIAKLRDGVNGRWLIKSIEHTLANGSLESRFECERGKINE